MIAVRRSLADPEALTRKVSVMYRMRVTECVLVRSLVNDVYRITGPDGVYALKVYRRDRWTLDEIAWEQDLVGRLVTRGVPVPPVVLTADGLPLGTIDAPEGTRGVVVTEYIEGAKPVPPFDAELYRRFGKLVGRFHATTDDFTSEHSRPPMNVARTLDEPLAQVLSALSGSSESVALISTLADRARRHLTAAAEHPGLEWGVCHGDVTLDNIHHTPDGLVLHDFDSAGFGWRAGDLVGVAATEFWDDFVSGYTAERPLADADVAAMPWLGVIGRIANLQFHLVDKPGWAGTESLNEGWAAAELAGLRTDAENLL